MPLQKSLLQDEAPSSLDGNDRLASTSDIHSAHTDNQSGKHTLEQLDENSELSNDKDAQPAGRQVKIKSPLKESIKSRESKLRERSIDCLEGASSSASVHFHEGEDQLNAVLSTSSPSVSNQPSATNDPAGGEPADNLMSQQTAKLNKSNLKTESYGEPVSKNIYVNVEKADNQSSKTSTSTKLKNKSDYIWEWPFYQAGSQKD